MDTTDRAIEFDDAGVCDHCRTFFEKIRPGWRTGPEGAERLERLASAIKKDGKGREFDCLIGMSGGIDSSYLLYVAKTVLGLRPLVFHVDAGWNSQIAVNNIEKMVDGLGLELYTEVINWEEMKDLQLSFFRSGVPHIDTPQDHAFFATMYKFSSRHNIKNILTGGNISTECVRNPVDWMYYQSDETQLIDIHRKFGTKKLKTFPRTSILWHKIWLPYIRGIRVSRPLDHLPYLKEDAKLLLAEKFGWQPYPQKHFESRFTKFYESYWLPERFGFDVRKVQYSSLILTDQMSRADALELLKQPSFNVDEVRVELEFVASKLDITVAELMGFMALPLKTYRDYRSQRHLYEIGGRVAKLLGLERGGKR
jgi:N-acetyl sugar amidotransferase